MVWTNNGTPRSAMGYGGFWTSQSISAANATFSSPITVGTPTSSSHAVTKSYVDSSGSGTVTLVGSGTGLTGGPITTSGTINADTNYLQRRVSSTCAAGSSIRVINSDGTVTCEADTDTDTNTNAATICGNGTFLNGDGSCDTISTYSGWDLYDNGTYEDRISEYEDVDFNSSTGVNVSYDGVDDLTFSFDCSDVAGSNLSCSGETLNATDSNTNASTICSSGYFLNGDGSCDTINTYSGWRIYDNGVYEDTVGEYEAVDFNSGTGVNVSYDGADDFTFSFDCSDVAGSGLSCAGETMSASGDISSVTAGTGLSGGGTSGAVTVDLDIYSLGTSSLTGSASSWYMPMVYGSLDVPEKISISSLSSYPYWNAGSIRGNYIMDTPSTGEIMYYDGTDFRFKAESSGVSGSGSTNYIPKWTGSTSLGNSLIFDSGTNVGIGSASPGAKLDVSGSIRTNAEVYINGGWLRVQGSKGVYWPDYGGGMQMTDSTWVRTYSGKGLLATGGAYGVKGEGTSYGGYFYDTNNYKYAYVGYGNYGLYTNGDIQASANDHENVYEIYTSSSCSNAWWLECYGGDFVVGIRNTGGGNACVKNIKCSGL